MNIKERIGQRIYTERSAKGLSRKALADLTDDLKQSRINNWERGDRTPGPAEIQQLAKALDVSPAYLMCLTDDKDADKPKKIPGLGALIPVLDFYQASDPKKYIDSIKTEQDQGQISFIPISSELASSLGDYAFALSMNDDSMSPDLLIGDILIVDPDAPPKPGDIVTAVLENTSDFIIRRYKELSISQNERSIELLPSNNHWASLKSNLDDKIILRGVVQLFIRRLKP
ncbi:XRE family transcriptional regulator [Legionella pneumophila serogroup 1]